ncbi:N-acetylmuramoyl-L-alanine amidase [Alkalihalobacillus sp. AL-G]|uniref:N-acetylmuramoyl-L-alanine amidase family protein n=1 Tax=Alkalihalobacillus sp. AL-G TaxID=2926399 RepID=UPI00272A92B9|nr:N-acetylmuramoyl-L-alanine amidase [Alkalihalobacillus sp. AL-G]WLD92650.1 N-acetylmuramoyl-L-alanine amidase [Alkalihalobacillus sp. AL-G]
MTKIYLDPGHGGNDSGAVGNDLQEKDLNLTISLKARDILLSEYQNIEVRMSRTSDTTLTLDQRTNDANAWGADYLASIHINAGGGEGFESYIYNGTYADKAETDQLRVIIHDAITEETGFFDRGKKEANFHMLRESNMPSVLTENGFIDDADDAAKLKMHTFLDKIARGHATGFERAFNLVKKDVISTDDMHRVIVDGTQVGAFQNDQNVLDAVEQHLNTSYQILVEKI